MIQTQLCLTLSALALQLKDGEDPEWGDRVVPWMIERFGKEAKDVGTLLEFLQVLPEEVTSNQRIPVDVRRPLTAVLEVKEYLIKSPLHSNRTTITIKEVRHYSQIQQTTCSKY